MVVRRLFLIRLKDHFKDSQPVVFKHDLVVGGCRDHRVKLVVLLCLVGLVDDIGGHAIVSLIGYHLHGDRRSHRGPA